MSPTSKVGRWALVGCVLLAHLGCAVPVEKRTTITVAAASSLTAAMEEVAALWNEHSEVEVRCTFGASSTLVRQIERGAPFDIVLSANEYWLDHLVASQQIEKADKFTLARNHLVIVVPVANETELEFETLFKSGRWALGDPDHVPVGIYGKRALEQLGHWSKMEDRVVPAANARAALRLVERGEVDGGIVYGTDATGSDLVVVVAALPSPRVRLMGCPLASAGEEAHEFSAWLQGAEVRAVLRRHGFMVN